jgi:hypothetical protein
VRRPTAATAAQAAPIVVDVDGLGRLTWTPSTPPRGWSTKTAADAAIAYAADAVDAPLRRRVARLMYLRLLAREGLRRTELEDRVNGLDVWADALQARDLADVDPSAEGDEDADAARL